MRALAVLRHRDFRLLFIGQATSTFGTNAVGIALAIYITRTLGSPTDLGLVLAAQTVPFVALLLFGGVWADRLPRHRVMLVSDVVRGLVEAAVAVLVLLGDAQIWELAVAALVFGTAWAFFQPAYSGLVPQTVPEAEIQPAQALNQLASNLSIALGPAVSTALVLTLGAGWAFAFDAVTFAISALTLWPMRPRARSGLGTPTAGGDAAARAPATTLQDLREGFHEVAARPWVWVTIVATGLTMLCFEGEWLTLGPTAAREIYGHIGLYGVFIALFGVGCVVGTFTGSAWRFHRPLRANLLLAWIWPAIGVVLGLGLPAWAAGIWMVLAGVENGIFLVVWETSLARHIPPRALSRVSAYDWMGSLATMPIGYVIAGPLAGALGVRWVLGIGGGIGMLAMFATLTPRSTRRLTAAPQPPPEVS